VDVAREGSVNGSREVLLFPLHDCTCANCPISIMDAVTEWLRARSRRRANQVRLLGVVTRDLRSNGMAEGFHMIDRCEQPEHPLRPGTGDVIEDVVGGSQPNPDASNAEPGPHALPQ
jgi:hypothetical protein